jgi:hypothetical protein
VIIAHARGANDGPSLSLGENPEDPRITSTTFGTPDNPSDLSKAITAALAEDGVLVMASCGYYWWTNEYDRITDIQNLQLDPTDPKYTGKVQDLKPQDPEYRKQWRENLKSIAATIRRGVAAGLRDVRTKAEGPGPPFFPSPFEREVPLMAVATPSGVITPDIE